MEIGSLTELDSIPVGCEPPALPPICALVATRCQHLGIPQVNKFEQVSGLGHQMSLAEVSWGSLYGVGGEVQGQGTVPVQ